MAQDLLIYFLITAEHLLVFLCIVFVVNGVDELLVDIVYLCRMAYKLLFIYRRHPRLTEEQLLARAEQKIAIMIPCWDESAVIRRMLTNTIRTVNYSNYHIFVGTYPNDPATHKEVELVREEFGIVSRIVCPKDGPTNKADCLNWVYEGIKLYEKEHGVLFDIFVMEDSEDIIHPLTLRLFNYLIPRMDMVQLPVFPMPVAWHQFTAGHYMDEFAENHARDLSVREVLSGAIPSAGVGTGYSRRALDCLAQDNQHQLFSVDSLTEDYDIGMRLSRYGLRQVFVRQAIMRVKSHIGRFTGRMRSRSIPEYIVIREFFPRSFRAAVRQKSRWVVGITLQSWAKVGWTGSFLTRYMLYRDRKALVTNICSMLANVLAVLLLALWGYQLLDPAAYRYPPLVEQGSWLWYAIMANFGFLLWRMAMRMAFVARIYGPMHALLSPFRLVWSNLINFLATMRAIRLYLNYLVTGRIVAWDKTAHVFPSEAELLAYRRKIGDLLMDKGYITVGQLDQALEAQRDSGKPLGRVMLELGLVQEHQLLQVLGQQLRIETREIDLPSVPREVVALMPRAFAELYGVFPLGPGSDGTLEIAVEYPLQPDVVQIVEAAVGQRISQCLVTRSDLRFAIRAAYGTAGLESALPEHLRGEEHRNRLAEVLRLQRASYARLGDVLVDTGAFGYKELLEAEEAYFSSRTSGIHGDGEGERFGGFLVRTGRITGSQLDDALKRQQEQQRELGRLLVANGLLSRAEADGLLFPVPGAPGGAQ